MIRRFVPSLVVSAMLLAPVGAAIAADAPKPLYVQTIERYPAPVLENAGGREYKFLIDAAKTKGTPEEVFKNLWAQVKAAATKNGFTVTEKEKNAFKVELSTKEYFDTADRQVWQKGYLIRLTNRYKDGKPDTSVALTVKAIHEDAPVALAQPLAVVGGTKAKTEAEENVGIGPGGALRGYVEKGSTVTVPIADLGKMTLGDFGKFVPELLKAGLPADTKLVGTKAHAYRVRPGAVVLPGTAPCGVSMEAWTDKEGGAPYLYDFSYGYSDLDFYNVAETHAAGEKFLMKVLHGELASLAMPESEKWGGSKVRRLLNRPIGARSAATGKMAAAEAEDLDAKYGVASPPAYIKHYEATKKGKVILNPYLQTATRDFPAVLEAKMAPYNWVIDVEGRVAITPEAAHPLGRTYEKGFFRPEDQSKRKPGTRENFGHVSALGGGPGRISGEILYDKETKTFTINNKSGRYSKHNTDRTPEQLMNSAALIREVVDPGETSWGPVYYLLEYAPKTVSDELYKSPKLAYDDPKKKSRPHVILMPGAPSQFTAEGPIEAPKVAAAAAAPTVKAGAKAAAPSEAAKTKPPKAKKPKAAQNDDPS